tara:strand:+ start:182 stop:1678 length:1497 start_codon:yes stop_codon:yes gene_type:complete
MINYDLRIKTCSTTLRDLVNLYLSGKYISFAKWLQRLEQEKKWTATDHKTARAYLERLLQTQGAIQGFLVCEIDFIIDNLESQKEDQPNLNELWDEMIKWLTDKKNKGATHIILDGQNRLRFAIKEFFQNKLSLSLTIDEQQRGNVFYKNLDEETKEQVDNHEVLLSVAYAGNVLSIVEQLIAINEGEPWSEHEKRCVLLTPVAYHINRIASYGPVVNFMKNLNDNGLLSRDYALNKKGDSLFIAEYLHYLRNGSIGSKASLSKMYKVLDDDLSKQLKAVNDMFVWIAKHLPAKHYNKNLSKEHIRDLIIFTSLLINKNLPFVQVCSDTSYTVKLSQIQSPELYLDKLLDGIKTRLANKDDIEPFRNKKTGQMEWRVSNAKPGTFLSHHQGSSERDIRARENLFIGDFNKIIETCVDQGIINTKDRKKISKFQKLELEQKYDGDPFERFDIPNLKSITDEDGKLKEVDHIIPFVRSKDDSTENLQFTSKVHNRSMGSK